MRPRGVAVLMLGRRDYRQGRSSGVPSSPGCLVPGCGSDAAAAKAKFKT